MQILRQSPSPRLVKNVLNANFRVLFLGYSENHTSIIDDLINEKCEVWHTENKIESIENFDIVISFGYRHILQKSLVQSLSVPIINLHISYLPWNRGAHPCFWALHDSTPNGVTIHLIDEGIDTGPILYQEIVCFDSGVKTFKEAYDYLFFEIEGLFRRNIRDILMKRFNLTFQTAKGTYHGAADLPSEFKGWHSKIEDELKRLSGQS